MRAVVVLVLLSLTSAAGWSFSKLRPKHAASFVSIASALYNPMLVQPPPAFAANDAFSGAMSAMGAQTRRQQEASSAARSFDELSAGAKKRFALDKCKDSAARKEGGYTSAAQCTSDVLGGNYATIVNGREEEPLLRYSSTPTAPSFAPISTPSPSPAPAATPTPSRAAAPAPSAPPAAPKPSAPSAPSKSKLGAAQRKKTQDLSGLSSSAQRRRALAGCKKAELRKVAGYRSESSCTERVLKDDLQPMIEALEYN